MSPRRAWIASTSDCVMRLGSLQSGSVSCSLTAPPAEAREENTFSILAEELVGVGVHRGRKGTMKAATATVTSGETAPFMFCSDGRR